MEKILKNAAIGVICGFILAGFNALCVYVPSFIGLVFLGAYAIVLVCEIIGACKRGIDKELIYVVASGCVVILLSLVFNKIGGLPDTLFGQPFYVDSAFVGVFLYWPVVIMWYVAFAFFFIKAFWDVISFSTKKQLGKYDLIPFTALVTVFLIVWATL